MPSTYTHNFNTPLYKGKVTINTGLYIGGKWVDATGDGGVIDVVNPVTGVKIVSVAASSAKDVDLAVQTAKKAFKTSWGLRVPGAERGKFLLKLADLIDAKSDEFSALEALNMGKMFNEAKDFDVAFAVSYLRYYAGWADKVTGDTVETNDSRFVYTRREPYGVVGQIIPWNGPLVAAALKLGPALAAGNTVVLKPSEITPLTALKLADVITEAGFPPGVVNIVNGYGHITGQAIGMHPDILKISFTGSTLTGRRVLKASAESNLKVVTLELGGKSPTIIFDDADLDLAVQTASFSIFFNMGQICAAGSRIFVQEKVYDKFVEKMAEFAKNLGAAAGDPFTQGNRHGPQISKLQFDRVMGYIKEGKEEGATIHTGGHQIGNTGYFIHPTIFTDVTADMKIAQEEIFGPVAALFKFKDEAEVIEVANDTLYGLACNLFTENGARAHRVAHAVEAGTIWVNTVLELRNNVPFGGYKMSGIGREFGKEGIDSYTQVKAVHVRL